MDDHSFAYIPGCQARFDEICKIKLSQMWNTRYQDTIMEMLDDREYISSMFEFTPKQVIKINRIINAAIRNPEYLVEDYHSFLYFCGMWGFRMVEHFNLIK